MFSIKLNSWKNLKGKRRKNLVCGISLFTLQILHLYPPVPCLWPVENIWSYGEEPSLPSGFWLQLVNREHPTKDQRKAREYEQLIIYFPGFFIWGGMFLCQGEQSGKEGEPRFMFNADTHYLHVPASVTLAGLDIGLLSSKVKCLS